MDARSLEADRKVRTDVITSKAQHPCATHPSWSQGLFILVLWRLVDSGMSGVLCIHHTGVNDLGVPFSVADNHILPDRTESSCKTNQTWKEWDSKWGCAKLIVQGYSSSVRGEASGRFTEKAKCMVRKGFRLHWHPWWYWRLGRDPRPFYLLPHPFR